MTMRRTSRMWRYGWLAYWLAFAAFTLVAAREPGFVPHPELAPYPWGGALFTCALLAFQTAALSAVLHPLRERRSWRRVLGACTLALLFGFASSATMVTDMPGYYYAPTLFAAVNVILVPIVALVLVTRPRHDVERATSDDSDA